MLKDLLLLAVTALSKELVDLSKKTSALIAGVPASIDNDVFGTDETIGFDTAVNTAVNEIDKIRDTAVSLERIFIVEVMGRTRGFLALAVGVTVGAEMILVPEVKYENEKIFKHYQRKQRKRKKISHYCCSGRSWRQSSACE